MPEMQDVPVIFLSAMRDVENIVRCFDSGGVDYISKALFPPAGTHRTHSKHT